jgi:hypothetical protein
LINRAAAEKCKKTAGGDGRQGSCGTNKKAQRFSLRRAFEGLRKRYFFFFVVFFTAFLAGAFFAADFLAAGI